jgi:hypothetical protein
MGAAGQNHMISVVTNTVSTKQTRVSGLSAIWFLWVSDMKFKPAGQHHGVATDLRASRVARQREAISRTSEERLVDASSLLRLANTNSVTVQGPPGCTFLAVRISFKHSARRHDLSRAE